MTQYRAYVIGDGGHILKAEGFQATDDNEAIVIAKKRFVDGHDVEIWQAARKVWRLKSDERDAG